MLGRSNTRTANIVKNMHLANSVAIKKNKEGIECYYIEFYSEYFDYNKRKNIPTKLIYVISSNLVHDLKQREKSMSK